MKNNKKKSIDNFKDQKIDGQNVKGGNIEGGNKLGTSWICKSTLIGPTSPGYINDLRTAMASALQHNCTTLVILTDSGPKSYVVG